MSENGWQCQTNVIINNKLQGTVITYLMCGGIVNNQINTGLLLSLLEKFFNLNVWHNYGQKGGLGHALSSPDFYCYF